jgi:hypothetical protein
MIDVMDGLIVPHIVEGNLVEKGGQHTDFLVRLQANVSVDTYSLLVNPCDECQMFC